MRAFDREDAEGKDWRRGAMRAFSREADDE
jgi:hypothetical protein